MLAKRVQLQVIADYLTGKTVKEYGREAFDPGPAREAWLYVKEWQQPASGDTDAMWEISADLLQVLTRVEGGKAFYAELSGLLNGKMKFPSLAEIAAGLAPVTWLWHGWLPAGMISLLAARPGTGKSLVALDLARRVIEADTWPDGSTATRPAGTPVVYVEAENVPQILNQRAERWGMDRRRLYLLLPEDGDMMIDLSTDRYQDRLANMVHTLAPGLIVIDSLGSCTGKGENSVEDVRQLMGYFSSLALTYETSLLMIHHLRKGSNAQMGLFDAVDMDMIRGSGHLAAMARVAMGLTTVQTGPEPDPNGPRKLSVIKTNLGAYPKALGLTLEQIEPDGVRLDWTPNAPKRYEEPTERDQAEEWLLGWLQENGPASPKDVVAAAEAAGIKRATVYRAHEALTLTGAIRSVGGRKSPHNEWELGNG